jgi:serine/threonine protein kinase
VKPSNILLGSDGAVKVADLGIASVPEQTRITTTGSMIGSLSYMAPEQLQDGPSTPAIDVYALSAVAYEVLSGRKARREANPVALAHAISTLPPPDLREAWPEAPAAVAQLLTRGMSRDPAARPASAGELIARLREALEPEVTAPVARPAGPADRGGRPATRLIAGGMLALVACAIVLAVALNAGNSGPRKHAPAHASRTKSASHTTSASSAPVSPAPSSGGPVSTVETFYQLAASHQYAKAWPLADPTLQSQLGGYESFQSGQAGDRSITFDSARTASQSGTSATVSVTTTSVRDNGTQHCTGTVDLSRGGSPPGWLMHMLHITCA